MLSWDLHEDQRDTVRISDVHLVQAPRFLASLTGYRNTARSQFILGGVDIAHLQPQGAGEGTLRIRGCTVPSQFNQ